jgi:hypothetical protein
MSDEKKPISKCNCCGEPCGIEPANENDPGDQCMGLVEKTVHGGYWSTPGNGDGALDDTVAYTFSMCEYCLDWLFTQFKTPPRVRYYRLFEPDQYEPEELEFRPAEQRVREDEWRRMKEKFFAESTRRASLRGKGAE